MRPFISVETFTGVFKVLPNDIEMIPELFEKVLNVFETLPLRVTLPDTFESLINMVFFTPLVVVGIIPGVFAVLLDF